MKKINFKKTNFKKTSFIFLVNIFIFNLDQACLYSVNIDESTLDKYGHKTFILLKDELKSFPITKEIENLARVNDIYINYTEFFKTNNIANPAIISQKFAEEGAKEITLTTEDGLNLSCTFFDRGKDKAIIIGPGFTNVKEKMAPFAHIYIDYDVLIINFRGHGHKGPTLNPLVKLLGIDTNTKMAVTEEKDVFAAVQYLEDKPGKNYSAIIGHGVCFGALIFAKAQAMKELNGEKLFDRLICDGMWHSLDKFKEKIIDDPKLIANPQHGGASAPIKWLFAQSWFNKTIQTIIEKGLGIQFSEVHIVEYVKEISIPMLLFYGKNDLTIYRDEFEEIWNTMQGENKIACINSNPHVISHLKQKELYRLICKLFIEKEGLDDIVEPLKDENKLIEYFKTYVKENSETISDKTIKSKKMKSAFEKYGLGAAATIAGISAIYAYKNGYLSRNTLAKIIKSFAGLMTRTGDYIESPKNA